VEPSGREERTGRGRPAALYRFRRDAVASRPAVGIGLPHARG
jgi:hypothetical protein